MAMSVAPLPIRSVFVLREYVLMLVIPKFDCYVIKTVLKISHTLQSIFIFYNRHSDLIVRRGIYYVRRFGFYLYKYKIYGTISIQYFIKSSFCVSTDINFYIIYTISVEYSFE